MRNDRGTGLMSCLDAIGCVELDGDALRAVGALCLIACLVAIVALVKRPRSPQ